MIKRIFDFIVSILGLSLFSPVFVFIELLIWVEDAGPVFYAGRRVGRNGRIFHLIKFRSMIMNADRIGGPTTSNRDTRITRIGRFLRRTKLDELPQLINVLKGDMSLVGPRPEIDTEVARYSDEQRKILEIRPGITDWASIWNSDEGEVLAEAIDPHEAYRKNILPTKMKLQNRYRLMMSFDLDIRLIFYTIYKIVNRAWLPSELRDIPSPSVPPDEKIKSMTLR